MNMAKRISSADKSHADYTVIPEFESYSSRQQEPWSCLKRILAMLITIIVTITAIIAGFSLVNIASPVRAGCNLTVNFAASCSRVTTEINARVHGQKNLWHDPHNNGTYRFVGANTVDHTSLERDSGTGSKVKYTDAIDLTFLASPDDATCKLTATSKSQVFSILDFGTNYCNINDLYCSDEACHPFDVLQYTQIVGTCTDSRKEMCYTA